jgi:hypothetical protein
MPLEIQEAFFCLLLFDFVKEENTKTLVTLLLKELFKTKTTAIYFFHFLVCYHRIKSVPEKLRNIETGGNQILHAL